MKNQNCGFLNKIIVVALTTAMMLGFASFAVAQGKGAASVAMFAAAAKEPTSVKGVSIIADRPKGFNPLTASSAELGKYGLPPRPDQQTDPKGFGRWARAMQAVKYRPSGVKAMPFSSKNLIMAKNQSSAAAISGKPTQYYSYNWSGVANTNLLKTWNNNKSFDFVQSIWNVPAAQPPFGACENGITGAVGVDGFYEVSWNGIDGFSNGDVLQGGSLSYGDCGGPADSFYAGWVEWYPSYPILLLSCDGGNTPCPVSPGDDFLVATYGANSLLQYVYVEDATQGWAGTLQLGYQNGPLLVGSSAEQIIERPCCDEDGYPLALANYIADFYADAYANNGKGLFFYPGQTNPATVVITMVDDNNDQPISTVDQGNTGVQGLQSLFFESEYCAYDGGCVSD